MASRKPTALLAKLSPPGSPDELAQAARELLDAIDAIEDARQRGAVRRALRGYLSPRARASAEKVRAKRERAAVATAAKLRIGDRARAKVCMAADVLRRVAPKLTMRQAAQAVATMPGIHHSPDRVHRTILEAFKGVWKDHDAPWNIVGPRRQKQKTTERRTNRNRAD